MKKKIGYIISLLLVAVIFFFVGMQFPKSEEEFTDYFYATITDIRNDVLEVEGLEINDINHTGAYIFSVEDTEIEYNHVPIEVTDLEIGDNVCVTYKGMVLESDPAQITVSKLWLLGDGEGLDLD